MSGTLSVRARALGPPGHATHATHTTHTAHTPHAHAHAHAIHASPSHAHTHARHPEGAEGSQTRTIVIPAARPLEASRKELLKDLVGVPSEHVAPATLRTLRKAGEAVGSFARVAAWRSTFQAIFPILIVNCTLLRITQHIEGLGYLLELLFRLCVPFVLVRMPPQGHLAVCLFDFIVFRIARYTQNGIKVAPRHCPLLPPRKQAVTYLET
mmetsp:Transcript_12209/g.30005  ORF Transcript_12209/g.30005 Transcript_12209/m.30005 type:complete len:211 (+) Transcript_12209:253-885(+)